MAKKKAKTPSDPFKIARDVAESAIGGPLFRPRKLRPKPPKPRTRSRKSK